jgi:hypothetical protein
MRWSFLSCKKSFLSIRNDFSWHLSDVAPRNSRENGGPGLLDLGALFQSAHQDMLTPAGAGYRASRQLAAGESMAPMASGWFTAQVSECRDLWHRHPAPGSPGICGTNFPTDSNLKYPRIKVKSLAPRADA